MCKVYNPLFYRIQYYILSDWSNTIYEVTNIEQSLGICYFKVKNNDGDILSRSFYKEELNQKTW